MLETSVLAYDGGGDDAAKRDAPPEWTIQLDVQSAQLVVVFSSINFEIDDLI